MIAYVLGWITAVYRLCVLKCGFIKDCIGVANLMRVLIASEFILFTICYGFYWLHIGKGFALSVKSPAMEFCTGTSQTFRGILGKQFDSKLWVSWQKIHFFDEFSLWSPLMLFIMESNIKLIRVCPLYSSTLWLFENAQRVKRILRPPKSSLLFKKK